jgi:hypothetical protein
MFPRAHATSISTAFTPIDVAYGKRHRRRSVRMMLDALFALPLTRRRRHTRGAR